MKLEVGGAIFVKTPRESGDDPVVFTGKNRLPFLTLTTVCAIRDNSIRLRERLLFANLSLFLI